jgi:hypothetical protein
MANVCTRELEAGLFGVARRKTPGDSFGESGRRGPANPRNSDNSGMCFPWAAFLGLHSVRWDMQNSFNRTSYGL